MPTRWCALQRNLSQQQRQAVTLAELRQSGIADAALAGLLRDAAMLEELHRLQIAVPASAVRDAITANPAFQDGQGGFSQFLYQSRLSEAGFSSQSFEAATREQLGAAASGRRRRRRRWSRRRAWPRRSPPIAARPARSTSSG